MLATTSLLPVHLLIIQVSGKLNLVQDRQCTFYKNYEIYAKYFEQSWAIQITLLYNDPADQNINDLLTEFLEMNLVLNKNLYVISEQVQNVRKAKLKSPRQPIKSINKCLDENYNAPASSLLRNRIKYLYYYLVKLFIVKDSDTFLQYLNTLDIYKFLKKARTVTVIVFSSPDADLESMQALLLHLWKKYSILNVMAQFPCSSQKEYVFTYKPFIKNLHGYGAFESYHYKFGFKHPYLMLSNVEQLNGYPLKLSQFERYPTSTDQIPKALEDNPIYWYAKDGAIKLYGIDPIMVAEMSRVMNFSVELFDGPVGYGHLSADGEADGSLKLVIDRLIDIQGNGRFITYYPIQEFEFLKGFDTDYLCLVTPIRGYLTTWQAMLKMLIDKIGIAMIVYCVCASVLNKWFSGSGIGYLDALMEIFGSLVIQAVYLARITRTHSHRLFFMACLMFSLVMSTVFTVRLLMIFTKPIPLPEIHTLEEFAKSGTQLMTSYNVFEHIPRQPYIDLAKRVTPKPPGCESVSSLELAAQFKVAGLERFYDADVQIKTTLADKNGNEVLRVVNECINTYGLAFLVPLGSPYLEMFNRMMMWATEMGLNDKWYDDFTLFYIFQYRMHHIENSDSAFITFNFEDFKGALLIFVIGNMLAIVVFLVELCWGFLL